jgi:hypothetical protein
MARAAQYGMTKLANDVSKAKEKRPNFILVFFLWLGP